MGHSTAIVMLLCLGLSACGIAAKVDSRNQMQQSEAAYKSCLIQNPQNVSACEGYRLAYEADLKTYRALSAGIQPGTNNTVNTNNTTNP